MNKATLVHSKKPIDFDSPWAAVACNVEWRGRLLFLKKAPGRWSENQWGVPCGNREEGEGLFEGMIRELCEETGWNVAKEALNYLAPLYIFQPNGYQYMFHIFYFDLKEKRDVQISDEHTDFTWATPEEFFSLDLIPGQEQALNYYYELRKH